VPHIKSSKKDVQRIKVRNARNRARKSKLRTLVKHIRSAENTTDAQVAFKNATPYIDQMARMNVIKKNKAARMKSRLFAMIGKMETSN
jgi:small subunit ribosomal protein S20